LFLLLQAATGATIAGLDMQMTPSPTPTITPIPDSTCPPGPGIEHDSCVIGNRYAELQAREYQELTTQNQLSAPLDLSEENTINDMIVNEDIPTIQQLSTTNYRYTILKNYLT
jgi:hypothetical protein